jgi:hypothetical protein
MASLTRHWRSLATTSNARQVRMRARVRDARTDTATMTVLPVFAELASRFAHCCRRAGWAKRYGGAMGITRLAARLAQSFATRHAVRLCAALLHALRETAADAPAVRVLFALNEISFTRACRRCARRRRR